MKAYYRFTIFFGFFLLCTSSWARGPLGVIQGAVLYDRSQRAPSKSIPFSEWEPHNSKWAKLGVAWVNSIPKFPEGTLVVQSDNGKGGSNTFWTVYDEEGYGRVSINRKETSYQQYTIVHFYEKDGIGRFELGLDELSADTYIKGSPVILDVEGKSSNPTEKKVVRIVKGPYAGKELLVKASIKKEFGIENAWDLDFNDSRHNIPAVSLFISMIISEVVMPSGSGYFGKIVGSDSMRIVSTSWIHEEDFSKLEGTD